MTQVILQYERPGDATTISLRMTLTASSARKRVKQLFRAFVAHHNQRSDETETLDAEQLQARQAAEQLAGLSRDFADEISASQKLINHWEHRKWRVDVSTSGWMLAPLAQISSSRKLASRSPVPSRAAAQERCVPEDYPPAARLLFADPSSDAEAHGAAHAQPRTPPAPLAPSVSVLVPSTPASPPRTRRPRFAARRG